MLGLAVTYTKCQGRTLEAGVVAAMSPGLLPNMESVSQSAAAARSEARACVALRHSCDTLRTSLANFHLKFLKQGVHTIQQQISF